MRAWAAGMPYVISAAHVPLGIMRSSKLCDGGESSVGGFESPYALFGVIDLERRVGANQLHDAGG